MVRLLRGFIFFLLLCAICRAQSSVDTLMPGATDGSKPAAKEVAQPVTTDATPDAKASEPSPARKIRLTAIESVVSKTETATGFSQLSCDGDGNLYLGPGANGDAIRKINSKAELVTFFKAEANPDIEIYGAGLYAVTPDGELYQWVGTKTEITRYVLVFKPDGSYKSNIKLDPGFAWMPASIAVFPNGNLLMTGQRLERKSKQFILPFTGIFRSDGKLLKSVALEENEKIPEAPSIEDMPSPMPVYSNRAVAWGQVQPANDGNIYIMRWGSPAGFYAVSPGGEVVKRFTVDPGDPGYQPMQMHIAGSRIALLFRHPDTHDYMMKIVDLDGKELAAYEIPQKEQPKDDPLAVFACYSLRPERFTFLGNNKDFKIKLMQAEAH